MRTEKLILGTVQFGIDYGINNTKGKPSIHEVFSILDYAKEQNINTLDTAEAYGNAHEIIGDYHRLNPAKVFKIITKISETESLGSIDTAIQKYLKVLHVNQLEGLMFHAFESYKKYNNLIPHLTRKKKEGLFKKLGVSVYTNDQLKEVINDDAIDLIQLPFNLLDNTSLRGKLMEEAKSKGKIIHTRSAFLQGLFFKNPIDEHPVVISLKKQLSRIHEIGNENNLSITSLALGYCLQQSNIDQVLIGVDSLGQLKSNIESSTYKIDERIIEQIDQIHTENTDLLNPSSWQ